MGKKFRDGSNRLNHWDYGKNGSYFITIRALHPEDCFGEVVSGTVKLSASGKIVTDLWNEIPERFPYSEINSFVAMPDHIHGIITMNKNEHNRCIPERVGFIRPDNNPFYTSLEFGTTTRLPFMIPNGGFANSLNPMLNENISRIVRWYKGRATFEIHKICRGFKWQPNYYDHVIRDERSFYAIKRYIKNNPANWNKK